MMGPACVLLKKELLDVVRNRSALVPVALVAGISLSVPFTIAIAVPSLTGHPLGEDADLVAVSQAMEVGLDLGANARVQLFLFQQFLLLLLLVPITGAMALAAHAVVGEKQSRTLEPLLATPITTTELLAAKVLGAFIPTVLISVVGLAMYAGLLGALAEPGVVSALMNVRTFALTALIGPAAALVSLQLALLVSSRVSDPRTAQQFGVLIVLPLTAVLAAQLTGRWWVSAGVIVFIGVGLLGVWMVLLALTVVLFDRESILTRWR